MLLYAGYPARSGLGTRLAVRYPFFSLWVWLGAITLCPFRVPSQELHLGGQEMAWFTEAK